MTPNSPRTQERANHLRILREILAKYKVSDAWIKRAHLTENMKDPQEFWKSWRVGKGNLLSFTSLNPYKSYELKVRSQTFNFFNVFLRERERESRGGAERGRQNVKQAPGSELSAQSPTRRLNPQTVRSWHEPKSDAQLAELPRIPEILNFLNARPL